MPSEVDQTPTGVTNAPELPHWAETPTFRLLAYLAAQAANFFLMFGDLGPKTWEHKACCFVIFIVPTFRIAVKAMRRPS